MKYGINVFNTLKGYYNLAIFNTKKEAEQSYELLDRLWSDSDFCEDFDDIDFDIHYDLAFSNIISFIENIYIEEELNEDDILENFKYVSDDVKILFDNKSVTVPC